MILTKEDIAKTEEIGLCKKGKILHILTKGGLSMIVCKTLGGAMNVMASAPHPGIARFRAEQIDKSIEWDNNLFKSESEEGYTLEKARMMRFLDEAGNVIKEIPEEQHLAEQAQRMQNLENWSTPENHYKLAQHNSHLAGKQAIRETDDTHHKNMMTLHHTDEALRHYQMAGLNRPQAMEEHKKNMKLHNDINPNFNTPAGSSDLELAWRRKQRKSGVEPERITGLGTRWSE
jgi:hypothetical protein